MEKYISILILSFYVYGVFGWLWESFILPIAGKYKIRNRGFLNGPVIPIYGFGALSIILLFDQKEKIYSIFIEAAVVACLIEYITSWAMEKIYHRRWWDYSHKPFNVNGRICLEGFVCFGVFGVICVKWIQPLLFDYFNQYQMIPLIIVATVFSTLFVLDIIVTTIQMTHLDEKIEAIKKDIYQIIENVEEVYNSKTYDQLLVEIKEKDRVRYDKLMENEKYTERRIINAFPYLLKKRNK